MPGDFRRDRLTWVAYVVLAWFAFLQAAPGLVIGHLRDELHLSYAAGGMHVAAFAAGSIIAGLVSPRLERSLGRRRLLWSAATLMGIGLVALTAGGTVEVTVASVLVMGLGGGLLLGTVQALLSDHHGDHRTVAFAEANLAASIAYVVLIGALSLAAVLQAGWRAALLALLFIPALAWWRSRGLTIEAPSPSQMTPGRLPSTFWIAAAMLFCMTAAEWCMTAWGATFVQDAEGVSTDTAVAMMSAYFAGVVVGRAVGSRLARRYQPTQLLALALVLAGAGFAILWPAQSPLSALPGLLLLGIGIGNLFPMGLSLAVSFASDQAALASGRAVAVTSFAVLLAPLAVGTLADQTSLRVALGVVPIMLVLAVTGLGLVRRAHMRADHAAVLAVPR